MGAIRPRIGLRLAVETVEETIRYGDDTQAFE
jgi:hypothetical protein